MKQIDIIKTYSKKRCLVVDNIAEERALLKRMVADFGCHQIDSAGNAEEAIEFAQRYSYDIVIADYQLGVGKNGQQLLEELRFHQLLRNTALFVMITAEVTSQHVLLALENQPDDYISKPITKEALRPRLDAALLKKEALWEINSALDQKRAETAIRLCEILIDEGGRYQNSALHILCELEHGRGNHEKILRLYDAHEPNSRPLWMRLGQARALLGMKSFAKAEHLLNEILAHNALCVEAYDLLAQCQNGQHRFPLVQQTLTKAIKLSPMAPARQRQLGKISRRNGDWNVAIHAYRAAMKYSRHSSQESAQDYILLFQSLLSLWQMSTGDEANTYASEARDILSQLAKRYGRHPFIAVLVHLLEADLKGVAGDQELANAAIETAIKHVRPLDLATIQIADSDLAIQCAKMLMDKGYYEEGEKILQALAALDIGDNTRVAIDKLLREPLTKEGTAYAAARNQHGIALHRAQKYESAIVAFQEVLEELPNHIGINLNLMQAIIGKAKTAQLNEQELHTIAACIKRIGTPAPSSPHRERYNFLIKRFRQLAGSTC